MRFAAPAALFLLLGRNSHAVFAQTGVPNEIEQLKKQVAAQQEQINELRRLLEVQTKLLAKALPGTAAEQPSAPAPAALAPEPRPEAVKAPQALEIGGVAITPTGFVDFSQVWRSKTVSSGLPTNFASIPFNNTVEGHRRQTISSAANTRLGMQINTTFSGVRLLGVVETDFLGYQPGNITTTANAYGLRERRNNGTASDGTSRKERLR